MAVVRMRPYTKRWDILCKNGVLQTNPMKHNDAIQVALWCDHVHPDCKPHIVQSKEKRTWAERKANG